ncbi:ABC transporter permease [Compostimonas suwonensis]|uniref:ABC transporter permease n=1 Tax=Compostimonas suwonensis TaxID=1048394 RepID=UPI001473B82C|nr:iron ABC transporter permease [Compostimonas suwonensis]
MDTAGAPRRRFRGKWIVGLVIAAFFGALLVYPVGSMLVRVFFVDGSFNTDAFVSAWNQTGIATVLLNTLIFVVGTGVVAIGFALVLAWINERTDARSEVLSRFLGIAPLLLPPIATSIGWVFLLSPGAGFINGILRTLLGAAGLHLEDGPLNIFTWPGMVLVAGITTMPFAYLPISSALRNMSPALEEASTIAGASTFRTFRKVTVPAIAPAMASAAVLVSILTLALYAVPSIIGTGAEIEVLAARIVGLLTYSYPPQTDSAVVLGLIVLVVVAIGSFVQNRLLRRGDFAKVEGKATHATVVRLGRWRWPARVFTIVFVCCISILPLAAMLIVSLQSFWSSTVRFDTLTLKSYGEVFGDDPVVADALVRSVEIAVIGATVLIIFSLTMSLFARSSGRVANTLVSWAAAAPGSLSHIIVGVAFVVAFSGPPFHLGGTTLIILLCFIAMYVPQSYFAVSSSVGQLGQDLLDSSAISGASQARTIRRIIIPLSIGGIVAGWTLTVNMMLSDVTASILLSGTNNAVLGYEILDLYQNSGYSRLAALAIVVVLVTAGVFLIGQIIDSRSRKWRSHRA